MQGMGGVDHFGWFSIVIVHALDLLCFIGTIHGGCSGPGGGSHRLGR